MPTFHSFWPSKRNEKRWPDRFIEIKKSSAIQTQYAARDRVWWNNRAVDGIAELKWSYIHTIAYYLWVNERLMAGTNEKQNMIDVEMERNEHNVNRMLATHANIVHKVYKQTRDIKRANSTGEKKEKRGEPRREEKGRTSIQNNDNNNKCETE